MLTCFNISLIIITFVILNDFIHGSFNVSFFTNQLIIILFPFQTLLGLGQLIN